MGLSPLLVKRVFGIIAHMNEQGTTLFICQVESQTWLLTAHRGYVLEAGSIVLTGQI